MAAERLRAEDAPDDVAALRRDISILRTAVERLQEQLGLALNVFGETIEAQTSALTSLAEKLLVLAHDVAALKGAALVIEAVERRGLSS